MDLVFTSFHFLFLKKIIFRDKKGHNETQLIK